MLNEGVEEKVMMGEEACRELLVVEWEKASLGLFWVLTLNLS